MSVKKIPLRQCIGCGEMKSKKEMIRVIKTAEGEILLDATGRKNGRGAYLCPSMECFKKAVKGRGLERSFKMAIPREVYETLEKTDKNKVFSMIGLATRARKVVSGEFSTEKSVKSGRSHMVIVSEEASDNTKKMFTNMCTHYKVPIYLFGTKEELGHAMGQEFRASLSVEDAGFAKTLASRMNVNGGSLNESK